MPLIKERIKYLNECLQDTEEGTDEYNDIYDEMKEFELIDLMSKPTIRFPY